MRNLKKFNDYEVNEGFVKNIIITLGTLLGLGLSKADAQVIKDNQKALSIVDSCNKYNEYIKTYNKKNDIILKELIKKDIKNSDLFMSKFIKFLPDNTIILSPDFIKGIDIYLNPSKKQFAIHYTLKF